MRERNTDRCRKGCPLPLPPPPQFPVFLPVIIRVVSTLMNLTSLLIRAKDRSLSLIFLFHFVFVPSDRHTRRLFFPSDFRSGIESDCREEDVNNSQNAHARSGYVTRGAVRPVLSLSYKGTAWYAKRSLRFPLAAAAVVCHRLHSSLSPSLSTARSVLLALVTLLSSAG